MGALGLLLGGGRERLPWAEAKRVALCMRSGPCVLRKYRPLMKGEVASSSIRPSATLWQVPLRTASPHATQDSVW